MAEREGSQLGAGRWRERRAARPGAMLAAALCVAIAIVLVVLLMGDGGGGPAGGPSSAASTTSSPAAPDGPGAARSSRDVMRPRSTGERRGTVVGAPTAHAALSDGSDRSYVQGRPNVRWAGGLGDLGPGAPRRIEAFVVTIRCGSAGGEPDGGYLLLSPSTFRVLAPETRFDVPDGIGTVTLGPYGKHDGGRFTRAQIDALPVAVDVGRNATARIYEVSVQAVYKLEASRSDGDGRSGT